MVCLARGNNARLRACSVLRRCCWTGSLEQFLRERSKDVGPRPIELEDKLRLACDVAQGMHYLSSILHIVHRSVAKLLLRA